MRITFFYRFPTVSECGHLVGVHKLEGQLSDQTVPNLLIQRMQIWTPYVIFAMKILQVCRGDPIVWPPRSTDQTPVDFLLVGTCSIKVLFHGNSESRLSN
jgi:hypothetical protein